MSPDELSPGAAILLDAQVATAAPDPVVHIVDDDEAVRRSLALLLNSCGHVSAMYDSAESFLARIDSAMRGCIIIDIRMPGMNGLTLQQELRARDCGLPVIIVTGHGEISLAVQAMKAGAVDFIEKPYSEADLTRAVNAALLRLAGVQ